jgi:hypothetical protein
MTSNLHPIFADILDPLFKPPARKIQPSYFVVMQDFGRDGREAIVDPEITRRGVIERLKNGDYRDVLFIHFIADGLVEDVTAELLDEAEALDTVQIAPTATD